MSVIFRSLRMIYTSVYTCIYIVILRFVLYKTTVVYRVMIKKFSHVKSVVFLSFLALTHVTARVW